MHTSHKVAIVVSTFNGAKYLNAQISSLIQQDYPDITIVVRDDGSTDQTLEMLRNFQKTIPNLELIEGINVGVVASFEEVLKKVMNRFHYIALCDQDDIWFPQKITLCLAEILRIEKELGSKTPVLVHSDLQVVDSELHSIASSFWKFQNLDPVIGNRLSRLLAQNVVTGCTIMMNKPLLKRALPFPDTVVMHDWWLALVARLMGEISVLKQPLVCYRQHTANRVGAKGYSFSGQIGRLQDISVVRKDFEGAISQAQTLFELFGSRTTPENRCVLQAFSSLPYMNRWQRIKIVLTHNYHKTGVLRNLGFLLTLLTEQRKKILTK